MPARWLCMSHSVRVAQACMSDCMSKPKQNATNACGYGCLACQLAYMALVMQEAMSNPMHSTHPRQLKLLYRAHLGRSDVISKTHVADM